MQYEQLDLPLASLILLLPYDQHGSPPCCMCSDLPITHSQKQGQEPEARGGRGSLETPTVPIAGAKGG